MVSRKTDLLYLVIAIILSITIAILIGVENKIIKQYVIFGVLGVILVFLIFLRPSTGAYVLIISVFTNISRHVSELGFPGINKPLVLIVIAGILANYIYYTRRFGSRGKTSQIELFILAYFAVIILSYIPASYKYRTIERVQAMAKDIIIIYCIIFALQKPINWKKSIWVIIITLTLLSSLGLYQVMTGNVETKFLGLAAVSINEVIDGVYRPRLGGPINAPNLWGQVLVSVLVLIAYRIVDERRVWIKGVSIIMMGVILFEILNTYSRGAYLALIIVLLLIFFELKLNPLFLLASIGFGLLFLFVAPTDYLERFESLLVLSPTDEYGIYEDSALRGRSSEILTGLEMFLDKPILGVGAGNYENNYQKYAQDIGIELRLEERQPHSLYVQILSETGILGCAMFAGLVLTLMIGLNNARKSIAELEAAKSWGMLITSIQFAIISYLITSLFLHGAYIRYFWIFIALAISCIRLTEKIVRNPAMLFSNEVRN